MTAYSLWSQAGGTGGTDSGNANAFTLGNEFEVSSSLALTGIWWFSPPGAAGLPSQCVIFDLDAAGQVAGTLNTSPSWSGAAGSGWVKCAYDGSVTLVSGKHYMVAVLGGVGGVDFYSQTNGYWTSGAGASGITNGPLSAPSSAAAVHGQSCYNVGSTLTLPVNTVTGYNFWVDVELSTSGTTHGGTAALSGSGTLSAAANPHHGAASLSGSGSLTATGADVPAFTMTFQSTDAHGVQTWSCTSLMNGPLASTVRILPPSSPNHGYRHSFLFALPVSTGTDATFGDPPTVIGQDLGAHNAYNTTVVTPSFPVQPWYADNPLNAQQQQSAFMLALANWMSTSIFASGGEPNYLIGFSKSGLGGQGMIFRRPDVWAACASWDAPFMATALDVAGDALTDPVFGGGVGGDPVSSYGTDANFQAAYRLSAGNLTAWNVAASVKFTSKRRLWIGGHNAFGADVTAYKSELSGLGFIFDGTWDSADVAHAWEDDWVAAALASIMAGSAPQAALSGSGTLSGRPSYNRHAAAALSGSGTLTASATAHSAFTVGILTASTSSGVNTTMTSP